MVVGTTIAMAASAIEVDQISISKYASMRPLLSEIELAPQCRL